MKDKTGSYRFVISGSGAGKLSGGVVLLHPFKNLAIREFAYPFHGTSKVRDALKIQYKPLLGESALNVGFIPFFTKNEKKSSVGCLFMTNDAETAEAEREALGISRNCVVWPMPMAFAGEVGPDGLIVLTNGDCVMSVWIKNWAPVLYRTVPGAATEDETARVTQLINESGEVCENIFVVDSRDVGVDELQAYGARTIKQCPMYAALDLSTRGTNIQEERERLFDMVSRIARAALISGTLGLLLAGALYAWQSSTAVAARTATMSIYETAFEERSMQPVASALTKLRVARDQGNTSLTLNGTLKDVYSAYNTIPNSPDMLIESLRYGSAGADIIGTAAGNEVIQRFRGMLEELGYTARTDNIQTVPGGKMRFNMNISNGDKQ
jgi:hypothetical protein